MPISHNRRLKYPSNRTVIDPITNTRVFYSDYLKMEEERQTNNNGNGSATSTASTPKTDNYGDDTANGWSSVEESDNENTDAENQEIPNKGATESVLNLGNDTTIPIDNDADAELQAQVNKSLSQKNYQTKKELLQAKAALRAEQLATASSKRQSKKVTTKKTAKKLPLPKVKQNLPNQKPIKTLTQNKLQKNQIPRKIPSPPKQLNLNQLRFRKIVTMTHVLKEVQVTILMHPRLAVLPVLRPHLPLIAPKIVTRLHIRNPQNAQAKANLKMIIIISQYVMMNRTKHAYQKMREKI